MENRVGFGRRLGALLIDCVIVGILVAVLGTTIGGMLGAAAGGAVSAANSDPALNGMAVGGFMGAMAGIIVATAVIGVAYFLIEGFTGWTFGKLIIGIQIGNADGTRAAVGTLLTRYAVKNCNLLLSLVAVLTGIGLFRTLGNLGGLAIFIGCFFVLGTAKQAFHDMIAKTAVYSRAKLTA